MLDKTEVSFNGETIRLCEKFENDIAMRNRLFIAKELFDIGELHKEDYAAALKNIERYYRER